MAALTAVVAASAQAADLTALSLEQLMQIGIVGASKYEQRQADVGAAVSVITRQEIKAHGWRTLDEALSTLPGVTTTYDRQYVYPNLRGFGLPGDFATRVLVTINGNRVNDPVYDQGPFGRILPLDMDLVERIEYIPGPGGAVYGSNAMLGVVNIVTRNGADVAGTELAAAAQQPQRLAEGRLTWGQRLQGGTELLLSVSDLQAHGENRSYTYGASGVAGVAVGLDYERDRQLFARLQSEAWALDVVYGVRRKGDPTANFLADPLVSGKYAQDDYSMAQVQYHKRLLGDSLQVSARAFVGNFLDQAPQSLDGTLYGSRTVGDWRGAELQLVTSAIDRHTLMVGLELQDDYHRNLAVFEAAQPANGLYIRGSGYRDGLYVQDEWHISAALAATLGLRADRNDRTGTQWSPRAALIWRAGRTTTFKALYGRASRAPNAFEHDYGDGVTSAANPSLGGERIDTVELVADHRIGTDLTLRASIYRWMLHDFITQGTDAVSGLPQYQSGPPLEARGLELSADKTWAADVRLRGSVSLQHVSPESGQPLPNSPGWLGKLIYSRPLPWAGLRLAAEWEYDSPRRTLDGSDLGGWGVANLNFTADTWVRGLELSLGLRNLFGKRYAEPAAATNWQNALDQDGRSVRLKLDFRF